MQRREFIKNVGYGAVAAGTAAVLRGPGGDSVARAQSKGPQMLSVVEKGVVYDKSSALIAGNSRCKSAERVAACHPFINSHLAAACRHTPAPLAWFQFPGQAGPLGHD